MQGQVVWSSYLIDLFNDPVFPYYRGIHLGMWITAVVIMYILCVIFIIRSKREGIFDSQKWLFRSFALFFGLMGGTRIFFIIGCLIEPWYEITLVIAYLFGILSLTPAVMTLEKYIVTKTHKIFSLLAIAISISSLIFVFIPSQYALSRGIMSAAMPFLLFIFVFLYVSVIRNSVGTVRKKSLLTLIGMVIIVIGTLLDSEALLVAMANHIITAAGPIVFSIGCIIIGYSQKLD
jgi:hypothetical protein